MAQLTETIFNDVVENLPEGVRLKRKNVSYDGCDFAFLSESNPSLDVSIYVHLHMLRKPDQETAEGFARPSEVKVSVSYPSYYQASLSVVAEFAQLLHTVAEFAQAIQLAYSGEYLIVYETHAERAQHLARAALRTILQENTKHMRVNQVKPVPYSYLEKGAKYVETYNEKRYEIHVINDTTAHLSRTA